MFIPCDRSAQNQSYVAKQKMAENCFLSKNIKKMCYFLFSSKQHFWGKTLKIFVFYIILLDFSSIFRYFESCLNDVEIWFFFFNGHSLIIMCFKI